MSDGEVSETTSVVSEGVNPAPIYAPPEAMVECLHLALLEERGMLIVALYGLTTERLEALVEAAQMIDAEGVEILDGPVKAHLDAFTGHGEAVAPEVGISLESKS